MTLWLWDKMGERVLTVPGRLVETHMAGLTPDCRILLDKFEGGGRDHHRHFLGRIYMRCSADVVQTGNVRFAISRLSMSYSRYYMRTYCVEGLYWVWKYGNDADPGTVSKNPVQ